LVIHVELKTFHFKFTAEATQNIH